jgi:hypothetical protein
MGTKQPGEPVHAAQRPEEPPPVRGGRARRLWKRGALTAVALFVVLSVVRSVLPALGLHVPGGGGKPAAAPTVAVSSPPPPTVKLDGVSILGGGQPLITLSPGLVQPGTSVAVNGSGFDKGARVDILLGTGGTTAKQLATASVSKDGSFSSAIPFPANAAGQNAQVVTAQQRGGGKVAKAEATVAQGVAKATLYPAAGKPGQAVSLSAQGFAPSEDVGVYWGRVSGTPNVVLHADGGGALGKVGVKVGVAPVGATSLFVVGKKSGSAASVPFQMLGLYPNITVKPYAVKATQRIGFSGTGFDPGERVLLHVNSAGGTAVAALPTDQSGGFSNAGFVVPFQLTGAQALVFIGEKSRATATAGFSVLPFQPQARASTYGALPGTSVSFYVTSFAPGEAVHVYVGRGQGGSGELVGAFRVDGSGKASAAGSYVIPGNAGNGVTFSLVGARSNASATATVKVDSSGGSVTVPPQPKYTLPPDLKN